MVLPIHELKVEYPSWVADIEWGRRFLDDREKMALAIEISRRNVAEGTGGPFGSALFDRTNGELIAIGMNRVVPAGNSTLHGEMIAFQMGQARIGSHSLGGDRRIELFTSCDPCAMCLGATLWSGVSRMVTGAIGEDARAIGFDEGPVFAESWSYLESRGIEIVRGFERDAARAVLDAYRASGAPIYNGR
jgi:tRNA(Arg) A34 adenosine deaminase TadA